MELNFSKDRKTIIMMELDFLKLILFFISFSNKFCILKKKKKENDEFFFNYSFLSCYFEIKFCYRLQQKFNFLPPPGQIPEDFFEEIPVEGILDWVYLAN